MARKVHNRFSSLKLDRDWCYDGRLPWNGALIEEFVPSRGVRQGDSLPPYLLVLGVERLGHSICDTEENGL
ncbi:hypothetical protein PVK06_030004 [Gossypium arboreum]|uniref:Reverse transcriptase n=1 Tax=Gossypium arboreum TaxID=29729 RepID=A0ABR0NM46_GOSAR|nr:hypothetical protein PVK06_030004 [Gossypium arboreum]